MNVQQLKLLAGSLRGYLDQRGVAVQHGHALDLITAIPGLRDWNEVAAFPDRVEKCVLEPSTAARLAFRVQKRHGLEIHPEDLLQALMPPSAGPIQRAPVIWPSGPQPGVYIATTQSAIDALLQAYEDATDGELVYAQRAASDWRGAIDLGENGLWAQGMERVPSGTLLVLGPMGLCQQEWEMHANTLEAACLHASVHGHRVAILVDSPNPDLVRTDLETMIRCHAPDYPEDTQGLVGIVTESGTLQPFPTATTKARLPAPAPYKADVSALPTNVVPLLKEALAQRQTGLLALGSSTIQDHSAIDLISAVLSMTEGMGPAARIKVRNRSTPAKDWLVPDAVKALPMLPSIQVAHAYGFKRIVVDGYYAEADVLLPRLGDCLFITGSYSCNASDTLLRSLRHSSVDAELAILQETVAALAVIQVDVDGKETLIPDLYLGQGLIPTGAKRKDVFEYVEANRTLRWEDTARAALDAGELTMEAVKEAMGRGSDLSRLAAPTRRKKSQKAAA